MIDRTVPIDAAVSRFIRSGSVIMVGGFGRGGVPFTILEHLADHADAFADLTLIKNDASEPHLGIGPLLRAGMVKKLIATHIGLNPEFIGQMNRGEVECELVPQGIFAERIRAGGAGIPALLTDIGVDTEAAAGKPSVRLDGETYLVERALRGDVALVCADRVDRTGNAWWRGSNRNMCVVMATACARVIVEGKQIVEAGAIQPEDVQLPGVFVDAVVQAQPRRHMRTEAPA
ncbi:MAG: 3-oxoacid CoA-transferase subunit A [Planctomycetota bacterium]|nr:3-oxoacid CoA-transferase subunit A [Planctomycetota bacterium]